VEPEELSREVERLAGRDALPTDGPLDPSNPLHVDRAAGKLLDRFFTHNDPAAFEALVELALPLLSRAALAITRDLGLAVPADSLVGEHMARLFVDLAPDARTRAGGAHFLAAAARAMEEDATAKVRAFAASPLAVLEALAEAHADPVDVAALLRLRTDSAAGNVAEAAGMAGLAPGDGPRLAGGRGSTASRLAQALLSTAFHRLERLQRRALLAREVDDLPLPDVAAAVGVGQNQIASTLVEARLRLAAELSTLLDTFRHDGGQGGGGGKRRKRR
jgi:DNA-directed RNA polymerase specialized sigma24 family protein